MKQIILTEAEVEEVILIMLSRDPVRLHNGINFLQTKKETAQMLPNKPILEVLPKENKQEE